MSNDTSQPKSSVLPTAEPSKQEWLTPDFAEYDITRLTQAIGPGGVSDAGIYS